MTARPVALGRRKIKTAEFALVIYVGGSRVLYVLVQCLKETALTMTERNGSVANTVHGVGLYCHGVVRDVRTDAYGIIILFEF